MVSVELLDVLLNSNEKFFYRQVPVLLDHLVESNVPVLFPLWIRFLGNSYPYI
jgi:hypothetical protein